LGRAVFHVLSLHLIASFQVCYFSIISSVQQPSGTQSTIAVQWSRAPASTVSIAMPWQHHGA